MKDFQTMGCDESYFCSDCGHTGIRLWRDAIFTSGINLICLDCLEKERGGKIVNSPDDFTFIGPGNGKSCKIPAVPSLAGKGWFGMFVVPAEGIAWWRRLPTRLPKSLETKHPLSKYIKVLQRLHHAHP